MLALFSLIPSRVKIYALVAVIVALALLRWRSAAVEAALQNMREQQNESRLRAIQQADEVRDEIDSMDDEYLADYAGRWLRGSGER